MVSCDVYEKMTDRRRQRLRINLALREFIEQDINPFGHRAVSVEEDDVLIVHPTAPATNAIPNFTQQFFLSDLNAEPYRDLFQLSERRVLLSSTTTPATRLLLYHSSIVTKARKLVKRSLRKLPPCELAYGSVISPNRTVSL